MAITKRIVVIQKINGHCDETGEFWSRITYVEGFAETRCNMT